MTAILVPYRGLRWSGCLYSGFALSKWACTNLVVSVAVVYLGLEPSSLCT